MPETIVFRAIGFFLLAATCQIGNAAEPPITACAFSGDGKSLVAVSQAGIKVYQWPGLTLSKTLSAESSNLLCVEFSPNGETLGVGGGDPSEVGRIELFAWPSGEKLRVLDDHNDSVTAVAWIDDSSLVSGSHDRTIKRWSVDVPRESQARVAGPTKPIKTYRGHSRGVTSLEVFDSGKRLVSGSEDYSLRVWDLGTDVLIRSMNQHTATVHRIAKSPVNSRLPIVASAAADQTIRFWQPTIGRMVRYVRLEAQPLDIAWNSDGTAIIASCDDGSIRVVDPLNVEVLETRAMIQGWAYAIAGHSGHESFAVGGTNGIVKRHLTAP